MLLLFVVFATHPRKIDLLSSKAVDFHFQRWPDPQASCLYYAWAHPLTLQHPHLLKRMNTLEEVSRTVQEVVESAQVGNAAPPKIMSDRAGLVSRITAAESVSEKLQESLEPIIRHSQTRIASLRARIREVNDRVQALEIFAVKNTDPEAIGLLESVTSSSNTSIMPFQPRS